MIGGKVKKDIVDYSPNCYQVMTDNQLTMEAILTRDQRTTSHRVLDARSQIETETPSTIGEVIIENIGNKSAKVSGEFDAQKNKDETGTRTSYHTRNCYSKRIRGHRRGFIVTWLRLGSLLVTLFVASIHAAPTMTSEDRRLDAQGKWVTPCGSSIVTIENYAEGTPTPDDTLLSQVYLQAHKALMYAQLFRDDYIQQTFMTNFKDFHSTWKDNHYEWLPSYEEIPKNLGEKLTKEFLDKLEIDTALLNAYEYLQKYAVGLEQIVWDQKDHNLNFTTQFSVTEYQLRGVLCEIQNALVERGVTLRPDVSRRLMTPQIREMSQSDTYRNLRDWLIFRDLMNGLEFVKEVFEHLRNNLRS